MYLLIICVVLLFYHFRFVDKIEVLLLTIYLIRKQKERKLKMDCDKKKTAVGSGIYGGRDLDVNSSNGNYNPLDLLPEEMWLGVFQRLDNPRDLLHAGEACSFFEDLLEKGSPGVPGAGRNVCELAEILPLVLKWLGKGDILNLRGACKRVSLMVDQVVEENFQINPYESLNLFPWLVPALLPLESPRRLTFETEKIKLPSDICPRVILDSEKKIEDLKYHLQKDEMQRVGRKMKIVGKGVCVDWGSEPEQTAFFQRMEVIAETVMETEVDCNVDDEVEELQGDDRMDVDEEEGEADSDEDEGSDDDEDEEEENEDDMDYHLVGLKNQRAFLEKCAKLIAMFPQRIRLLNVTVGVASDSYLETYKFLCLAISSLPNLRRLEYNARTFTRYSETELEVEELTKYISGHPLPPSPNLECISFKYFSWPEVFLREVCERYGDQLKDLRLVLKNGFVTLAQQQSYAFPVLRELNINLTGWVPIPFEVDAPLLKSLAVAKIPTEGPGVAPIISLIMKYPMLVTLQLDLENYFLPGPATSLGEMAGERRRHINLKHLTIFYAENSNIPLRFFTQLCPNLESITVVSSILEGDTMNRDFKMMHARCMKKSEIWKVAPNLKKVKHVQIPDFDTRYVYVCTKP